MVLVAAFLVARWRGLSWAQGALTGVTAGIVAAVPPLCLAAEGLACAGAGCPRWCASLCALAGALAGVYLGARARDARALVVGAAIAMAAAALGCWPVGIGVVAGTTATIMMGGAGALLLRRSSLSGR